MNWHQYQNKSALFTVLIFSNDFAVNVQIKRPQNFAKFSPYFRPMQCQSKVRWRYRKILWPSQNIWTLTNLDTKRNRDFEIVAYSMIEVTVFQNKKRYGIFWQHLAILAIVPRTRYEDVRNARRVPVEQFQDHQIDATM